MRLRPVPYSDLSVGVALPWTVYDRTGRVLLNQGAIISSDGTLESILRRGMIEVPTRVVSNQFDPATDLGISFESETIVGRLEQHVSELEAIHNALLATDIIAKLADRIAILADDIIETIELHEDQALGLLQIDATDDQLARRLLHATLLVEIVARAHGVGDPTRRALRCAALTFDTALAPISRILARQPGPLTLSQSNLISGHPQESVRLLQRVGVDNPVWLDAIRDHHERIDGSGYPQSKRGDEIGFGARLLALADTYTAMIRARAYRQARFSREALRDIFLERGKRVDERLASLFVKELGVFPPGTLLRLANGEIALVVMRTRDAAHPFVRSVIGWDGAPVSDPQPRDVRNARFAVVEVVSPRNYRNAVISKPGIWSV